MDFPNKPKYQIGDLLEIMRLLRGPDGCPWDKQQTHHTIRRNFLEEAYEAAEAIDDGNPELLREELGDVLLQVVFHCQMEAEQGGFDFDDVCDGICRKLIERHPHIFAGATATTPQEVLSNWEDIKKQTKGQSTQAEVLGSVPKTLPALMRSEKIQQRAAKVGFDYPDTARAFSDLESEVSELASAIGKADAQNAVEELGDLLFSVVNVARFLSVDPERALEKSCEKFVRRFAGVERLAAERGVDMLSAGIDRLDILWQEVKKIESKNLEVF